MKYFLDSAIIEEIRYAYKFYKIDGVTTNPKHIMNSGKTFYEVAEEIASWINEEKLNGVDKFPVSLEIDPFLDNYEDMIKAARKLNSISENFVIKITCTEEGLKASKILEEENIRTNITLVFSPSQAIPVGRIGAKFVSPFLGWKENSGDSGEYIKEIIKIYKNYNFDTEIIVAAVRNGKQISDFASYGADIITCGLQVLKDSFYHPFTDYGINIFQGAWENTKKE